MCRMRSRTAEFFGRPSNQSRDGAVPAGQVGGGGGVGDGEPAGASMGGYRTAEQPLARDLLKQGCFGPGMLCRGPQVLSWSLARDFLAAARTSCGARPPASALKPVKVLADGTYLAELKPPRKSDGPPVITVRVIEYTVHTAPAAGGHRGDLGGVRPGDQPARRGGGTRRWTWRAATRSGGAARPSSGTTRRTWARASPSCGRRTPPG